MATIVERDTGTNSAMTMVVALVALVIIVGVILYAARVLPFAAPATTGGTTANPIHVDVNAPAPTTPAK